MVEIKNASVDWKENCANSPRLKVLVDEIPNRSEMRFENDGNLWVGEKDGFVSYFSWSGEGNDGGFSGRHYDIETVDGEEVTLKGPWSSRAGCVNNRDFDPVIDVVMTDSESRFNGSGGFKSGSITVSKAQEALEYIDEGVELKQIEKFDNNEPYWIPRRVE